MAVHCIDHSHARFCGLLRRTLRHIELGIQRVKLERVVMVWTGRRSRTHIAIRTQAHLAAAIGQLPGLDALGQACRRSRNIPDQPMGDIHLRSLVEDRLGIVQKQNETLRAHGYLRPFQFGIHSHRTGLLCVFVRNDAAIFPRRRRHQKRRNLRTTATASAAAASATLTFTLLGECGCSD